MPEATAIEWTDTTWNPVRGCSRVSRGCEHCYAERIAATRLAGAGRPYEGLAEMTPAGPRWTGRVELQVHKLDEPLRWREPRRVFVNSMSDLFHEELADYEIAGVFGAMAAAPQHTFQVLTKRPERMRAWFDWVSEPDMYGTSNPAGQCLGVAAGFSPPLVRRRIVMLSVRWPLPNVWLGVSVEDQAAADERIPWLLDTPAAVRFVSAEPLLGPVDLKDVPRPDDAYFTWKGETGVLPDLSEPDDYTYFTKLDKGLDWVICGGESGPGHRQMDLDWARQLRDQCADAGVPFFMKQMAGKKPIPEDLVVRQFPEAT